MLRTLGRVQISVRGCTRGSFDDSRGSRRAPWALGAVRDLPMKGSKALEELELASLPPEKDGLDGCSSLSRHPLTMRRGAVVLEQGVPPGRRSPWKRGLRLDSFAPMASDLSLDRDRAKRILETVCVDMVRVLLRCDTHYICGGLLHCGVRGMGRRSH